MKLAFAFAVVLALASCALAQVVVKEEFLTGGKGKLLKCRWEVVDAEGKAIAKAGGGGFSKKEECVDAAVTKMLSGFTESQYQAQRDRIKEIIAKEVEDWVKAHSDGQAIGATDYTIHVVQSQEGAKKWSFSLKAKGKQELSSSNQEYNSKDEALKGVCELLLSAGVPSHWAIRTTAPAKPQLYYVGINGANDQVIAMGEKYPKQGQAQEAQKRLLTANVPRNIIKVIIEDASAAKPKEQQQRGKPKEQQGGKPKKEQQGGKPKEQQKPPQQQQPGVPPSAPAQAKEQQKPQQKPQQLDDSDAAAGSDDDVSDDSDDGDDDDEADF